MRPVVDRAQAGQPLAELEFDLLVLDLGLPGMSGWEVTQWVRVRSTVPILMVTAEAKREQIVEAAQAGVNGYVVKPFTAQTLKEKIEKLKASVRAKVEHPFLTLKRLWGFAKVRYRGLAKNANRAFAMLAMVNLVKWGRPLTGEVRPA